MLLKLHIGTCKTGTTSIQNFLLENKEELLKQDILYPNSMKAEKSVYHNFFYLFGCDPDVISNELVWYDKVDRDNPSELLSIELDKLRRELDNNNSKNCIISNEQLSSNLKSLEQVQKIKSITDNLFDEVEIVVYIRRPIEYYISNVSTRILGGDINPKEKPLSNKTIIELWSKTYGNERIKVKIFDKNEFFENDFIKDFCLLTNIKLNNNFVYPPVQNDSLNMIQLKYLNFFNEKIPKLKKEKGNLIKNPLRRNLISFIRNNFQSETKYLPSETEYKEYEEYFIDDDKWIREKFFSNKKSLFGEYKKGFRIIEDQLTNISKEEVLLLEALSKVWIQRSRTLIENEKIKANML